jgi:hypothetical protein
MSPQGDSTMMLLDGISRFIFELVSSGSVEELAQIATAVKLPENLSEWFGANLLLRDIPKLTQSQAMVESFTKLIRKIP